MAHAVQSGLEGVIAAETQLSQVNGQQGSLILAGIPVELLAPVAQFEETVFLLWQGHLPSRAELQLLCGNLAASRHLAPQTLSLLEAAAAQKLDPMEVLAMAGASLGLGQEDLSDGALALRALAAFPTVIAAYHRLCAGKQPVAPREDLGHVANYLYMLRGEAAEAPAVRALNTYFNTVADHGLNASTFAARVIISTGSDVLSACVGAIGALKGPLHGGAPGPALAQVFEIGEARRTEAYLRAKLERGERLMGFGHRVYKVRDPRADVLAQAAAQLAGSGTRQELYHLARHVEQTAVTLLDEYKPGRRLRTNVEYYTALLLHSLDLPEALFTPSFAAARVAGWTAHCLEQRRNGRLIRPKARYTGGQREWLPLDERL